MGILTRNLLFVGQCHVSKSSIHYRHWLHSRTDNQVDFKTDYDWSIGRISKEDIQNIYCHSLHVVKSVYYICNK